MGGSEGMKVANTAIGAAANRLYNIHMADGYKETRLALFGVGLPLDTYTRLFAYKTEYHDTLASQGAHDDAFEGEAVDPQLDATKVHRWIRILHAAAKAYAADAPDDGERVKRRLGVGTSPSDNPRQAFSSVGKLLKAIAMLGDDVDLKLPPGFVAEGQALAASIPEGEKDRDSEYTDRLHATARLTELEDAMEKIFNQVLTRADMLEEITGKPVPGVDFGYLRAAAAPVPAKPTSAGDGEPGDEEPGL